MSKWLLSFLLLSASVIAAQSTPNVTLSGTLQGPNGLPVKNAVISLTPTQQFYVPGNGPVCGSYIFEINSQTLVCADTINFNNLVPAAPTNGLNVQFATSKSGHKDSVSAAIVGDGNPTHCLNGQGQWSNCGGGSSGSPPGAPANSNQYYLNSTTLGGTTGVLTATPTAGEICNNATGIAALAASGNVTIQLPAGTFTCTGAGGIGLELNQNSVKIVGAGWLNQLVNPYSATTLTFTAGNTGIDINAASITISDLNLFSADTGANTDDGIRVRGGDANLERLSISHFGRNGILTLGASPTSADNWHYAQIQSYQNYGDGYQWGTPCTDNHEGVGTLLIASVNAGWGFQMLCGSDNLIQSPLVQDNTLGGFNVQDSYNQFFNTYCEEGTGSSFDIGSGVLGTQADFNAFGQCLPVASPGPTTAGNKIYYEGVDGWPGYNIFWLVGQPGASGNRSYEFTESSGDFTLFDYTDVQSMEVYDHVTGWNFPQAVTDSAGLTASSIVDSGITPSTSPICPHGTGGAFTTVGCTGGGSGTVTGTGTANTFPLWTSTTAIGNSLLTNVTSPNGVNYSLGGGESWQLDASHLSWNSGLFGSSNVVIANLYNPGSGNNAGGIIVQGAPTSGSAIAGASSIEGGQNGISSTNAAICTAGGGGANGFGALGGSILCTSGIGTGGNGNGQIEFNDQTGTFIQSGGNATETGKLTAGNFVDTAISASTNPICPNGTGGAFTTLGCAGLVFTPQTNGVNNAALTGLNFLTSTVNAVGLTITPSNPSTTGEKFEITGSSFTGNSATASNLSGCTPSAAGDVCIYTGSAWLRFAGNTSGTAVLQENASGVPSWGSGASTSFDVNGTPLSSATTVNFLNSAATNGQTFTFTNPSAGGVQLGVTGTLNNAGLTNSSLTINSQAISLGSSGNIPFQTNSTNNSSLAGLNFETSTANTIGLIVTPTNSSSNIDKFEVTGAVTNAGLVNDATTVNGVSCVLGSTCSISGTLPSGGQGQPLVNTTGSTTYATSPIYLDASQFLTGSAGTCTPGTNDNICIANAIAAISGTPASSGGYGIIDARTLGSSEIFTANPFANIISNGTTNYTASQKCGLLRLGGGNQINMNQPLNIPPCWDVEVVSQRGSVENIQASSTWPAVYTTGTATNAAGTHIGSGAQYQFTAVGSGTTWTSNVVVGEIFAVCQNNGANGVSCGGNGTTTCATACGASAYGMVLAVTDNTHLVIGTNSAAHSSANASGVNYVIYAPLVELGVMGQTGGDAGGPATHWKGGTLNCSSKPGCRDIVNYSEQENTTVDTVQLDGAIDNYIDISGSAFNSGPYSNLLMNGNGNCVNGTIPIETRIPGATRPIQHFTINMSAVATCAKVGVDWENGGELWDGHMEWDLSPGPTAAINVGQNASSTPLTTCPVICIEPSNAGTGAYIHGLYVSNNGTTGVNIGSQVNTAFALEDISFPSFTNTLIDNGRSPACTVAVSGQDGNMEFYERMNTGWFGTASASANACASGGTFVGTMTAGSFVAAGTTAGAMQYGQGSTNTTGTTDITEQAPTAVTSYLVTKPGVAGQGAITGTLSGTTITQGFSGDTNHAATVTIGSGTSIGSTALCSTAICPAGTYRVNVYMDITTACGTSGTYVVDLIYTDDQGSKTIPVNINGTGAVPATGVLTTTSTANFGENAQIIRSTGSASINYSTTATACGTAGPMVGKLYLSVEPVQ